MATAGGRIGRLRRRPVLLVAAAVLLAAVALGVAWWLAGSAADPGGGTARADFGADVVIFSPTMPPAQIQARVNSIARQQAGNQFGNQRYALLFEPGTY